MAWWYNNPSQTIVVWEDPPVKHSMVLDVHGEPFTIAMKPNKMGFDLTPKEYKDARKAEG